MKTIKKITIACQISIIVSLNIVSLMNEKGPTLLCAHDEQLDVTYDDCVPSYYGSDNGIGDGEHEKWYELTSGGVSRHLPNSSQETSEVLFYISNSATWENITDEIRRDYVKSAIVKGIDKWSKIYFYQQNGNGAITKAKLVNIRKGTLSNHNLEINPYNIEPSLGGDATTSPIDSGVVVGVSGGIEHWHYASWKINFNIYDHLTQNSTSETKLNYIPTHEFGHVLGLRDIDLCENDFEESFYHHEELLMGFSNPLTQITNRQSEITYKDLAGVAITRGLHTDADHSWIYDYTSSSEGNLKLICSICNGVKYVSSLAGYTYVNYKACNNLHNLSNGNMFPVACYENKDYYKCKYCRYVAPFSNNVEQNYSYSNINSSIHHVYNQVTGLNYSFNEPHNYSHHFINYSSTKHKSYCSCGQYILSPHAADGSNTYVSHGHIYAPCIFCGTILDLGGNGPIIPVDPFNNCQMVTDNGSYILPNGIYVIMEEDLDDYINGTLVFHQNGENTY